MDPIERPKAPAPAQVRRPARAVPPTTAVPTRASAACPPDTGWLGRPQAQSRRLLPDLTGMYEQISGPGIPSTVALSTAGRAIVGWFALPPGAAAGSADLKSWPTGSATPPLRSGSFVVDTRKQRPNGEWDMWWWVGGAAPGSPNDTDPHLLTAAQTGADRSGFGRFRASAPDRPDAEIVLRFDPAAANADVFRRYRSTARLPAAVALRVEPPAAKALLEVEQVQPMAPRWVSAIVDKFAGSKARELLGQWLETPTTPPAARRGRRLAIINQITTLPLSPGYLPDPHRKALLGRLAAVLKTTPLRLGSTSRSLWSWYELVAAEDGSGGAVADRVFSQMGVATGRATGFGYIVKFAPIRPKEVQRIIKGSYATFTMEIRKVPVKFVMDGQVRRVDPDGNPVLVDPTVIEEAKKDFPLQKKKVGEVLGEGKNFLIGGFLDVGVGIGYSFGYDKDTANANWTRAISGGGILSTVTFYSSADLKTDDFDGAWFHIASLKGPSAKIGNILGAVVFSTVFNQMNLRNGVTLEAVVTQTQALVTPEFPSWQLLLGGKKKLEEYINGWAKPWPSIQMFDVSVGYGIVKNVDLTSKSAATRQAVTTRNDYAVVGGTSGGVVLFKVDSADLRTNAADMFQDGRYLLEIVLAASRSLLTSGPNLQIRVEGFASPEHTACHNLSLSQARAATVRQALLDAFMPAIPAKSVAAVGHGERPALASGLQDPPDDPTQLAQFRARHPEQVNQWPGWRKVEVTIEGVTAVRGLEVLPTNTGT